MKIVFNESVSCKGTEVKRIFVFNPHSMEIFEDKSVDLGVINIILGRSGCGKTTLANLLSRKYGYKRLPQIVDGNLLVIDLLKTSLKKSLYWLNVVGLAEVPLYLTKYCNLSTGQKLRFDIAFALSLGYKKLYIDEFCSYLDRPTAKACAYSIQKCIRKIGGSLLLATAHDDLIEYVKPDVEIRIENKRIAQTIHTYSDISPFENYFKIKKGSLLDYLEFEKYHYFQNISNELFSDYKMFVHTLYYKSEKIGVVLYKQPYDCFWETDEEFLHINHNVVILNRIIIHPSYRGIGASTWFIKNSIGLLSNYRIVYVATALGKYIPFFEKAGFNKTKEIDFSKYTEYKNFIHIMNLHSDYKIFDKSKFETCLNVFAVIIYLWYKKYNTLLERKGKYNLQSFKNFLFENYEIEDSSLFVNDLYFYRMNHYT